MSENIQSIPHITINPQPKTGSAGFVPSKANAGPAGAGVNDNFLGEGGFFSGLLDIINPLQHIPVVSTIYRHLTGDTIAPGAKLAGGTLFGGVLGFISAAADAIFTQEHGKDIGETALAMFTGDAEEQPTQVAQATPTVETDDNTDNSAVPVSPVAVNPIEALPTPANMNAVNPAPALAPLPPNLPPALPEALRPSAQLEKAQDLYKQAQILSQLENTALRMQA